MPAPLVHARPRATGVRRGFTLIELIVVLVLMGLAFALVAPTLARPSDADVDPRQRLQRVVDAARTAAIRRGETMHLEVRRDGRWTVTPAADTLPLHAGTLDAGALDDVAALRLTISPLGACMPDVAPDALANAGAATIGWDVLRCTVRAP